MSGETEKQVSGWTVDTLKEHVDSMMAEKDKRDEQRFIAQKEAIGKVETATEKRFESVNEFRAQLSDQTRTLLPRTEFEAIKKAFDEKIETLKTSDTSRRAKNDGISATWGIISILIGIVIAIIGLASRFIK